MKKIALLIALAATTLAFGQHPWQMERKDRWGTARQDVGPATLTNPWVYRLVGTGGVVSHAPSLREDGVGFYGMWVTNSIYKFDWTTGDTLGSFFSQLFSVSTPAIGNNGRIFGSSRNQNQQAGYLFGIDSAIMDYDWFANVFHVGQSDWENSSPVVGPEGDVVQGGGTGLIRRYNGQTGATVWERTDRQYMSRTMCFTRDDTKVIVPNGNQVTAINWNTGAIAWNINLGSVAGSPGAAPNGTILVGSDSGTIYALNPNTGAIVWTRPTLDHVRTSPAFSADGTTAYFTGSDTRLYALRIADGVRLWSYTALWNNWAAPSVGHDGTIYFCDRAGRLFAIRPNGTLKWMMELNGESRGPMSIGPDGTLYVPCHGSVSGLYIIRQIPAEIDPAQVVATAGSITTGTPFELLSSDDVHVKIADAEAAAGSELRVRATSPVKTATKMTLTVESSSKRTGWVQFVEVFNYTTNAWVRLDRRNSPTTDLAQTFVLTSNAGQLINQTTREIQVRFVWRADDDRTGISDPWDHQVDTVHWTIEP